MAELELFQAQRPRLFSIAYRMLGSASDAEDVLQDAWVRFHHVDTANVRSPEAFAVTIVTRLCLDRMKSARAKREEYVGPWLPEPVLTTDEGGPDVLAERFESVTLAFLVLLETLSAEERAVFLLKEVFDYEHTEIADMLGTTPANSRQPAYASGVASHAAIDVMEVNSEPALVLRVDGHVDGVFVLSIEKGSIAAIRVIRNPDKLAYLRRQLAAIMAR